jgi:hypothetical protein
MAFYNVIYTDEKMVEKMPSMLSNLLEPSGVGARFAEG